MAPATAFVYGPHLQAYNPSEDAERPLRRELGIELLRAYGLLDHPDVRRVVPRLAAEAEARGWGFQDGDTIARPGMHEAAAAAAGSALTGALEIWEGRALQAFCPAPAG